MCARQGDRSAAASSLDLLSRGAADKEAAAAGMMANFERRRRRRRSAKGGKERKKGYKKRRRSARICSPDLELLSLCSNEPSTRLPLSPSAPTCASFAGIPIVSLRHSKAHRQPSGICISVRRRSFLPFNGRRENRNAICALLLLMRERYCQSNERRTAERWLPGSAPL